MIRRIMVLLSVLILSVGMASAQTAVNFALDWKFEGPSGAYFSAIDEGHFVEEGLEVDIWAGQGSLDAIPKVATGAAQFGFADINSLIKFLDQNQGAPVIGIMMVYDKPPFAVVGRKSLGVEVPKDLEGRILGAPPPDGAWAQFPAFASANNLDVSKITVEPVGFPTREPSLAEGVVHAITGFSFSSYLNLVRLGVPEEDITTILMADYGLQLYGNSIIVNTEYAAENPEIVSGFIRAIINGWKSAVADPAKSVESIAERNPALDKDLETWRLNLAIDANVYTDYVQANGMGNIDADRFQASIEQLAENYEFTNDPDPSLYFTDEYLGDAESRMIK